MVYLQICIKDCCKVNNWLVFCSIKEAQIKNITMSAYIPKIVIEHYSNIDKVRFENANGEIQMLIEKDFVNQDKKTDDEPDNYLNPHSQK
jgi:hypothetical protein